MQLFIFSLHSLNQTHNINLDIKPCPFMDIANIIDKMNTSAMDAKNKEQHIA
jgi:hypothetical protein